MIRLWAQFFHSVFISLVVLFVPGFAAAAAPTWVPPSNIRIVQVDRADNVRTFLTLGAAMQSIVDASGSNPYLIRVGPGTFEASNVKPYVAVEGSGAALTTIWGGIALEQATLSNVTVTAGGITLGAGGVIDHVNLFLSSAPLSVTVDAVNSADVIIRDSTIRGSIVQNQGGFRLIRSKIVADSRAIVLSGAGGAPTLPVDIEDAHVVTTGSAVFFNMDQNRVAIRHSILEGPTAIETRPEGYSGGSGGYAVFIAGSQVTGSLSALRAGVDKVVNCYDGTFSAIPNQ